MLLERRCANSGRSIVAQASRILKAIELVGGLVVEMQVFELELKGQRRRVRLDRSTAALETYLSRTAHLLPWMVVPLHGRAQMEIPSAVLAPAVLSTDHPTRVLDSPYAAVTEVSPFVLLLPNPSILSRTISNLRRIGRN